MRLDVDAVTARVGAFPLMTGARDVVLLLWLLPGAYSARITSADGREGDVLLEIYDVPGKPLDYL